MSLIYESSDSSIEDYSSSEGSKTPSDFDDYETFLFGKTVKPTYIEREEEIQKDDIPEFDEDLYANDLTGQYDRMGEIRSTLESEVMVLISSFIVKESLDVSSKAIEPQIGNFSYNDRSNHNNTFKSNDFGRVKSPATNVASALLKNIYHVTGNVPVGRFSSVMSKPSRTNTTDHFYNITSVSPQATDSLRDLSALLQRERGNIYHECDGILLSQHPRFVTMYILENRIVETHLLPLLEVVEKTTDEADQRTIVGEMLGIINFLVTPPPREWLEYWQGVDRKVKKNKYSDEVLKHPEFIKQLDITHKYSIGLSHLKRSLNQTFYRSLIHLRLEIQNWSYSGYKSDQSKKRAEQLKLRQAELVKLRDSIIKEQDEIGAEPSDNEGDTEADINKKGRLRRNKARTNQINMELLEVQKELLKDADDVRSASLRAEIQSNLIRNLVYNLIKLNYNVSADEYLSPLLMICENDHVTLLDIFFQEFLEIFQAPSVQMGLSDSAGARVSYINSDTRGKLWEFLRLIHVIMMAVPNTFELNIPKNNSFVNQGSTGDANSYLINPRAARIKMAHLRQSNKQTRHHRYWSQRNISQMLPFQPLFYSQASILSNSKTINKRLLDKIRLFVGVDEDFDLVQKLQTNVNGGENESQSYNLGILMNALSYDLLRDAGDEYCQPNDWKILISVHTWIVEHYSNLFAERNKKRDQENLTLLLSEYMLVSLKPFIGNHSTLTSKLIPELFARLRGNGNLTVKNSESFYLIFRLIIADLNLIKLHVTNRNSNVLQICRDSIGAYLSIKIVKRIFWVLSKWKPIVGVDLITSALRLLKLLKQLISTLGYVEYSPIPSVTLGDGLDIDDDLTDDEIVGKKVTIDNLYHKDHRQLRSGRIISSLIGLLSYSVNPITNDLIIRYLEEALSHGHHALCWDLPSIQSLYRILSSDSVWNSPQTRWVGQFAFDIVESFFLKWNKNNLFLPLELWFFKNRHQTSAYSSTSPIHLQSLHKCYAEDTIDFEISRHLRHKSDDIKIGKYAPASVVNEAISSAIETFGDSGYLESFKNMYSNKLPSYSDSIIQSISQYMSLNNLSIPSDLHKMMKLILGNHVPYFSPKNAPCSYSVTVSDSVLSALQSLYHNVSEAIQIAEIQGNESTDEMANLIEIPNQSELSQTDVPVWDNLVSKLGLNLITLDNSLKMYSFGLQKSMVKQRFNELALSTHQFTTNTIELCIQSLLDIASEAFEKVGSNTLKNLIDKIATAAESLIRYSQMGHIPDYVTIPFSAAEMELASNDQLKCLMESLGVAKFDLSFKCPYQILRLKNILNALPSQLDENFSLSIIVQYIIKFGQRKCFDRCYDKIIEWQEGDLVINYNDFSSKSKIDEFSRFFSVALSASWYSDKIIIPVLARKWSKKIVTFMHKSITDFKEAELITRIREWRTSVSNGEDPFSLSEAGVWNSDEYDSDFELDGNDLTTKVFAAGVKRVVYDSDESPGLVRSRRDSTLHGDLTDEFGLDNNVETHSPKVTLPDVPAFNLAPEAQFEYIRTLYKNSLQMAREGVSKINLETKV